MVAGRNRAQARALKISKIFATVEQPLEAGRIKSFAFNHCTLARWTIFALLTGCGGVPVAPSSLSQGLAVQNRYAARDLLYVADYSQVDVFGYPSGERVQTLTGYYSVTGVCSDRYGNVWVINKIPGGASTLLEYAHAGTQPIATLNFAGHGAAACAVDSTSGNLAVGTMSAKVAIWKKASGSPAVYSTRGLVHEVRTMTYDGSGNLYLRGYVGKKAAWLPKGGSAVRDFEVRQAGAYAWDGTHLVITGRASDYTQTLTLYRLHGGNGKAVGHVGLDECNVFYARDYGPALSIAGSAAAITCGVDETASVHYYDYPAGGKALKTFYGEGSITISVPEP
jgi:hypothetical protein